MKLRYLVPLLLVLPAAAAITPGAVVTCSTSASANLSCQASADLAVSNGNAILVFLNNGTPTGSKATYSLADTCGNQYQKLFSTAWDAEIFYVLNAAGATCRITATRPAGTNDSRLSFIARTYTGVVTIGASFRPSTSQNTPAGVQGVCTNPLTATVANSYIESVFGFNQGTGASGNFSAASGTLIGNVTAAAYHTMAISSVSSAAGAQVTNSVNYGSSNQTYCYPAGVELVPSTVGGRNALVSDAMLTVIMSSLGTANYSLSDSLLGTTPPGWCTWVMPSTNATHDVLPGSTKTLNGQSNLMMLPQWQMTRLCQDSTGNYWANPPLVAGSNITITPSPTAITISASTGGGGGGATVIQHGIVTVPATSIPAGSCISPAPSAAASGVQVNDVVNWSYRTSVNGEYELGRTVRVSPWAEVDTVRFAICNPDTSPMTTGQQSLNWQVVR